MVGIASKIKPPEAEEMILKYDLLGTNIFSFKKLYKDKLLFTSIAAQKNQGTESYVITYIQNASLKVGCIQNFIRVTNCDCKKIWKCPGKSYACIKRLKTTNPFFLNIQGGSLHYIHQCTQMLDSLVIVDIVNLKNVCIYMKFDNENTYVCEPVNTLEFE